MNPKVEQAIWTLKLHLIYTDEQIFKALIQALIVQQLQIEALERKLEQMRQSNG